MLSYESHDIMSHIISSIYGMSDDHVDRDSKNNALQQRQPPQWPQRPQLEKFLMV